MITLMFISPDAWHMCLNVLYSGKPLEVLYCCLFVCFKACVYFKTLSTEVHMLFFSIKNPVCPNTF